MSRYSRRRRKSPPFVMVEKAMLRSPEWKALSKSTMILWIYLKARFNGYNAGELRLSYAEMRGLMAPATISKAFKELEANGWIEKTKHGGLFRFYNTYRLIGPWSNLPG